MYFVGTKKTTGDRPLLSVNDNSGLSPVAKKKPRAGGAFAWRPALRRVRPSGRETEPGGAGERGARDHANAVHEVHLVAAIGVMQQQVRLAVPVEIVGVDRRPARARTEDGRRRGARDAVH